jgi:hypothetical protein
MPILNFKATTQISMPAVSESRGELREHDTERQVDRALKRFFGESVHYEHMP